MCRWPFLLVAVLVLAQASEDELKAKQEYKGEVEGPPRVNVPAPRDGYWAPPPGESGAARHAPRPGPGGPVPDTEEKKPIEIDSAK